VTAFADAHPLLTLLFAFALHDLFSKAIEAWQYRKWQKP
jgi:hypothetical protein